MKMDGRLIPGPERKSALMNAIIEYSEMSNIEDAQVCMEDQQNTISICVIDAMVVVHSINMKGRNIETCKDFAKEFAKRCRVIATGSQAVRLVFDRYFEKSLKESTRNLRRREAAQLKYRIEDSTKIKETLKEFLAHNKTKCGFVTYLAEKARKAFQDASSNTPLKYLVSADGKTEGNLESHSLNNYEEADTLMVLLASEATKLQHENHPIVVLRLI